MSGWTISPLAREELAALVQYIGEQSGRSRVAERVLDDFLEVFSRLSEYPDMGKPRPELGSGAWRSWIVHHHVILYEPGVSSIRVARIVHSARRLEALLDQDSEITD